MRSTAHCIPIYLYGSLQYFADVRSANAINNIAERIGADLVGFAATINTETTTTPGDSSSRVTLAEARAPGVDGGEGAEQ